MLINASFYKYNSAKLYSFYKNLLELLERINEPTLTEYINPLREMQIELEEGYKLDRNNKLTVLIKNTDRERYNAIAGLKRCIEGFTFHFETDKQVAAKLLLRSINKYKNIARLPYAEESAAINNILKDWSSTKAKKALTTLGIVSWFNELKEIQEKFNSLYLDRIQSEALKTKKPITKLRFKAIETYKTFTIIIVAFEKMMPTIYLPIINQINELIKKYNNFLRNITIEEVNIAAFA